MLRDAVGLIMDTPAFAAGRKAGGNGDPKSANPYTQGSRLFSDWTYGWHFGSTMTAANKNRAALPKDSTLSPFELGNQAAAQGLASTANPWHFGHPSHDAWRLGWAQKKAS